MKMSAFSDNSVVTFVLEFIVLATTIRNIQCETHVLTKLVSPSASFASPNESICFSSCSQNTSAVSYSPYLQQCVKSKCANLQLIPNALWKTYVCVNLTAYCNLPTPMFDWMLTDACGFANTGWSNTGALMYPIYKTLSSPWNATYMPALGDYAGNSLFYTGQEGYMVMSQPVDYTMDLRSNSLTLFSYFWLSANVSSFLFVEFWNDTVYAFSKVQSRFWWFNGGIHYDFRSLSCTANCFFTAIFQPPLFVWTHTALVYNASSKIVTIFINGTTHFVSNEFTLNGKNIIKTITAQGRPDEGKLRGTTFCLKVFQAALTVDQINNVAKSCTLGYGFTRFN